MNYYYILVFSALSVAVPLAAGLLRWNAVKDRYVPFVLLLACGLLNELISLVCIHVYKAGNIVNGNIYPLIELYLFLWFFYCRGQNLKRILLSVAAAGTLTWFLDNLVIHSLKEDNTGFKLLGSLAIIVFSMEWITRVLFQSASDPYRKTDLMLAFCFFVYYTYQAYLFVFDMFRIGAATEFYARLWVILGLINMAINFLYLTAILWIPAQKHST